MKISDGTFSPCDKDKKSPVMNLKKTQDRVHVSANFIDLTRLYQVSWFCAVSLISSFRRTAFTRSRDKFYDLIYLGDCA